ncbi:MAG: SUMF1/EgtB/PvdO family nonheme iron enzyme [Bacteroidota bacterium]
MRSLYPYLFLLLTLLISSCIILKAPTQKVPPITQPKSKMILVEGGEFLMGDVMGDYNYPEERVHTVYLSTFEIASQELSFAELDRFCEATGYIKSQDFGWGRDSMPATGLSWYCAITYCNWLSIEKGYMPVYTIDTTHEDPNIHADRFDIPWKVTANWEADGFRLPTEAEWEYAARERGRKVRFGNGKDTANPFEMNFDVRPEGKTPYSMAGGSGLKNLPIHSFQPNALGLYNMSGNVGEWCWDWYEKEVQDGAKDPKGPEKGDTRIMRGGRSGSEPKFCRNAERRGVAPPDYADQHTGFRLARSPK